MLPMMAAGELQDVWIKVIDVSLDKVTSKWKLKQD